MPKHGKKYAEAVKNVNQEAFYEPAEAVVVVKKMAAAKFDG